LSGSGLLARIELRIIFCLQELFVIALRTFSRRESVKRMLFFLIECQRDMHI
jgi:hypothetical protein